MPARGCWGGWAGGAGGGEVYIDGASTVCIERVEHLRGRVQTSPSTESQCRCAKSRLLAAEPSSTAFKEFLRPFVAVARQKENQDARQQANTTRLRQADQGALQICAGCTSRISCSCSSVRPILARRILLLSSASPILPSIPAQPHPVDPLPDLRTVRCADSPVRPAERWNAQPPPRGRGFEAHNLYCVVS